MNYAKAQKDVLTLLTKTPKAVMHCVIPGGRVGFAVDGVLGFIFPEDANWIDCEKVEASISLSSLHLPSGSASEVLTPTENLIDRDGIIAREFHKQGAIGECKRVFVQEKWLKNFDMPTLYQAIDKPVGIISITETTQLEGEQLVGFVMPYRFKEI